MKIKNVKLFRRRAKWHAKEGHVKQGTYGEAKINGKVEFQGCFVGCLATPHTKSGLLKFLRFEKAKHNKEWEEEGNEFSVDQDAQHARLTRMFGLAPALLSLIEAFFEAQPTHAEAIDFIPAVGQALHEGADIKPKDVREFVSANLPEATPVPKDGNWLPIFNAIKPANHDWTRPKRSTKEVREDTIKFLDWLRAQKP